MTRKEQLEFCKKCLNRKLDLKQGLICNITQKVADFEGDCENFKLDESVKEEVVDNEAISHEEIIKELDDKAINKLRIHQDFYYAIIGGLLATLIGAVIWAMITVTTQYQIGYMAIGIGILVGFSVRFFGAGMDKKFGYLGAVLSLLGCLSGNLFSQVGFIAQEQSLGYFETLTYLNIGLIVDILVESFNPIDLLFYGISTYAGYRFSFRKISGETLVKLKSENYEGFPSNYKLRMPLVMGSIVVLSLFFFKIHKGVSGFKTYYYESGKKMSEGELKNSKEHGIWTYWYENGNTQFVGFYSLGLPDSLWQWFDETGKLRSTGHYKKGLEHGIWINYNDNGLISDSGSYFEGRMNGLWEYWFESGDLYQSGYFNRNLQDSIWTTYHENGQLTSVGNMSEGDPVGDWTTYYPNGQLAQEIVYKTNDKIFIKNTWDIGGKQIVENGTGFYKSFSETGQLMQSGRVENGTKVGKWNIFFENGKLKEEGVYKNEIYQILNSWDSNGVQNVKDGFGTYITYYSDGEAIFETGEVKNGHRDGLWKSYYESSGNVYQELQYKEGKLTGLQKFFYKTGQLYFLGEMIDGLREGEWNWYYANGNISSNVNFKNDKKEGTQTMWSETGEKVKEEYYENGMLVEEKTL